MFALTTTLTNLFIATALIPSAFGSTFRHLNAESYQAVMSGPPPYCFIENGFDYVGNDIANVPGQAADCCNKCSANGNCKVWSWSNYNGGTCWLKSGRGEIIVSPNVKSAVLFYGYRPTCQASDDIDYPGNDLVRVDGASVADCCSKCQNYAGCRAYSWTNLNGGSCWLKSKVTQIINKPGVKSAQAYPDIYDSCVFVMYDTDFVGNDIGNKPSGSYAGCCDICKTTPNCKAYSWSNHNGGTCWLKSKKGQNIYNPGVISAQVYPDNSLCNIQADTDYVDNDIGNVPGKDAGECCGKCHERSDCKAFAWSDQNGGTCWLKSAKGQVISKPGVSAGTI